MPKIHNLTDTWNDGGTAFDAIKIDVTDTASAAESKLLDLQIGGTSKFKVDKDGNITNAGTIAGLENVDNTSDLDKPVSTLQATAIGVVQTDVDNHEALTNNPHTVTAAQVGLGNVDNTSDLDKPISTLTQAAIDAAGGGAFGADANTLITPSTPIVLDQATDEAALTLDYTVNKASGNDTGLLINQTDTLSPGTSKLLDLQVGGVSKISMDAGANISGIFGYGLALRGGGTCNLPNIHFLGRLRFVNGTDLNTDAANTLAQRNGVSPQTFNIYNTYTNATNYERGHIGWNDTADTFVIGTEAGSGGGTLRGLQLKLGADRVLEISSAPLYNVAVGHDALASASLTGSYNIANGYESLRLNTTGGSNVAYGYQSLYSNTSGSSNVAAGTSSLRSNTTGGSNVASGYQSLYSNTSGSHNIASGYRSLRLSTTGTGNVASGYQSLYSITSGGSNVAIGYQAGRYQADGATDLTVADDSIFLGKGTRGVDAATNQIVIGDTAIGLGSNTVVLGADSIVTTALKGNVGITSTWNDAADTFTLIKADVTDTASAAGSKLLDLQVGGVSKLSVDSGGEVFGSGVNSSLRLTDSDGAELEYSNWRIGIGGSTAYFYQTTIAKVGMGVDGLSLADSGALRWASGSQASTGHDLLLTRDAANTLAQRNGINAQTFNLYNTYTSATDYERGFMKWNSDVLEIGTEAGSGGGVVRNVALMGGDVGIGTASPTELLHVNGGKARFTNSSGIGIVIEPTNTFTSIGNTHANDDLILSSGKDLILKCWDTPTFAEKGRLSVGTGLALVDSIGLHGVTPPAQASHIADATNATDVITRVNAILVALENIGITASV